MTVTEASRQPLLFTQTLGGNPSCYYAPRTSVLQLGIDELAAVWRHKMNQRQIQQLTRF